VNGRIEDVGTTEAENTVMLATGRRLIMRLAAYIVLMIRGMPMGEVGF
jgi:hypothetical protein